MYGTVEELDDGRWRLRFVRNLPHPVETVWRAITEPEHLATWFPTTIDGDRAAGARLRFTFPNGQAPAFDGEVISYQPPSLFEFRWGTDLIRLEIEAAATGTRLTLFDTLVVRGKAARDAAGWHTCLDALASAFAGGGHARDTMNSWNEVHPHYVREFGAEGATLGPP